MFEVIFLDDPVQMDVDEILPGRRAPVSQQHVLDVRERQRPLQQRIVVEINLADRQIIGRAPVGVNFLEQFGSKGVCFHNSNLLFNAPEPRKRQTERAIISSSSVRMMRTVTRALSIEITDALFGVFRIA